MKNLLLILALIFSSCYSSSQSFDFKHDHSTIQVENMNKSVGFYNGILKLKELDTPWPENNKIRFFKIGNNQQLHIAQTNAYGKVKVNKVIHFALAINDLDFFINYLNENEIDYSNFKGESKKIQKRPDGVRQIYIQDPDGYWVEINDAKH